MNATRQALRAAVWMISLAPAAVSAAAAAEYPGGVGDRFLVSVEGSGRATAYLESPKIVTFDGRTHATWLDTPEEGFRVRIRTLDQATGEWSAAWTIGRAENNHGGPALTIDEAGFLHVLYYSHHHPFRYRRSVRANDASAWTDFSTFGTNLTYPALVVAKDGTLIMTARRSYEDRPWELEMWSLSPGESWKRKGAILRSRFPGYAQFAASLAWGPDHRTLYLGTRIYELPEGDGTPPLTTVGLLKSQDGGATWERMDGSRVSLPADGDSLEVIASGRGREGRILNAGSIAVSGEGLPVVPYSVRLQDTSQGYLATPAGAGGWRHLHLNPFLPAPFRDWGLFMHGGLAFGQSGQPTVLATIMQVPADGIDWGHPSTEIVRFQSADGGSTFTGEVLGQPDPLSPRWMPNIERPTGFNEMLLYPAFLYTDGVRGDALDDQLENQVWFVR